MQSAEMFFLHAEIVKLKALVRLKKIREPIRMMEGSGLCCQNGPFWTQPYLLLTEVISEDTFPL